MLLIEMQEEFIRNKKTRFIVHGGKVISAYIKCLYETLHFTSISVF